MNKVFRASCLAFALFTGLGIGDADAAEVPEAVQRLYRFFGHWNAVGTIVAPGQPTIEAKGFQRCSLAGRGVGIFCEAGFRNDEGFVFDEGIMGGYDAATNTIRWAVINSFGQAFTLIGQWTDSDNLVLQRTEDLGGGLMLVDSGTFTFNGRKRLHLSNITTVGGQVVSDIQVDFKR